MAAAILIVYSTRSLRIAHNPGVYTSAVFNNLTNGSEAVSLSKGAYNLGTTVRRLPVVKDIATCTIHGFQQGHSTTACNDYKMDEGYRTALTCRHGD